MKNILKTTLLCLFGLFILAGTAYSGNKPFKGIITYKISYPNSEFDASILSQLPKALTVYISQPMIKTSINMGMGAQASIINTEDKTSIMLIDMMGQKYAVREGGDEIQQEAGNYETSIEETEGTKEIAGYTCKKAFINVKDKKSGKEFKLTIFYTDEILVPGMEQINPMFKDVQGTLLEYEQEMPGMNITMLFTATYIKKTKVSKSEFEVPKDYKETTKEELRSNFGGGM